MTPAELVCIDDERRKRVRSEAAGGIDYVEVSQDQRTFTVYFIGAVPTGLQPANVLIDGGRTVRDIDVIDLSVGEPGGEDQDGWADVRVDRPGDYSTYRLRLVALDPAGKPTDQPLPGVDPRYASVDFSFKAACPSDADCEAEEDRCPPVTLPQPEIDYLAKDYASFRRLILDRLSLIMPDWKERHVPDLGITLVEILAYVGDYLSYFQDAVATEAYLQTARQRISVRRHVRLIDYRMHEGCNARAWVCLAPDEDFRLDDIGQVFFTTGFPDAPAGCQPLTLDDLDRVPTGAYEVFEPLAPGTGQRLDLYAAHNAIPFWAWGNRECCIPQGAVAATLKDGPPIPPGQPLGDGPRVLHLQVGDVLIFEEVKGPSTGAPGDADPTHRQLVRLTKVRYAIDPLYRQPIVDIEWAPEDRLTFPLCLSAIGQPPECVYLDDLSVVRGNVLLVDHGRTVPPESLGQVPQPVVEETCEAEGEVSETIVRPVKFAPELKQMPVTFSQPLPAPGPLAGLLLSDPRLAVPQVSLVGTDPDGTVTTWHPRYDLLTSGPDEAAFVVEVDNEGYVHLRFGDGELGRFPEPAASIVAHYRVGNGTRGNVGAESISHLVLRNQALSGIKICVRNPLPAAGGRDGEAVDDVKKLAPAARHSRRERAITADDYAELAQRNRKLQRAAATLSWTGSWYEADVDLDPLGAEMSRPGLVHEVTKELEPYRRIGHDLRVLAAAYVPLDLGLLVCLHPHALRAHVRAALREIFSNRTLRTGARAFFHPDNLTFGQPIYVSRLVAVAQATPGVESVSVTRLERLFEGPNDEVERGVLRLGPMEIAQLDNHPAYPERGRLHLELRGGR